MGEAGAGPTRSSVAEVAPLEAAARGISARPGMRGSLTVTKEAEKELLGGLQCVICFFLFFMWDPHCFLRTINGSIPLVGLRG